MIQRLSEGGIEVRRIDVVLNQQTANNQAQGQFEQQATTQWYANNDSGLAYHDEQPQVEQLDASTSGPEDEVSYIQDGSINIWL